MNRRDKLNNEYFEWMYGLVCNDEFGLIHRKLLYFLHDTEFRHTLKQDSNRASDGIDFRYRFGYECGYSRAIIAEYLDTRPCSVLEMMISLAFRVEEQIMDDPDLGNRTGQWFWNMIVNLGLGCMTDSKFDIEYTSSVIELFLRREYESNGNGGLFTVTNTEYDMRSIEIWYQMMWYLDENFDFSI